MLHTGQLEGVTADLLSKMHTVTIKLAPRKNQPRQIWQSLPRTTPVFQHCTPLQHRQGTEANDNKMGLHTVAQLEQNFECSSSLLNLTCEILSFFALWETLPLSALSKIGITSCKTYQLLSCTNSKTTFQKRMQVYLEEPHVT